MLAALSGGMIFATKMGDAFSRVWVSAWLAGGLVATVLARLSMRLALRQLRRRGRNLRHIAIVGAGTLGHIAERSPKSMGGFGLASTTTTRQAGTDVAGIP
jgi:putative colanic acid biosynthesis UDP-glucose lipid carrier transferase